MFSFEVVSQRPGCRSRLGIIHTFHGDIKTPSFVAVGSAGTVKSMTNEDLKQIGTQVFFVNTYHIYLRPGLSVIKNAGGLHKFIGWTNPLMTDSAGFQVFSLARENNRGLRVVQSETQVPLVKIDGEGVRFRSHLDGAEHYFNAEKSIEIQGILGADIMIAFDECTFYPASEEYSKLAMERTHRWAIGSLEAAKKYRRKYQGLYGVIQGGSYKNLREESARYISSLPFEGIAIGGVSVGEGKEKMIQELDWVVPLLPREKPLHLLGVGEIDDIFNVVEKGVDSFDCVMPTRLGRMGFILSKSEIRNPKSETKRKYILDLNKSELELDERPIDKECRCMVCKNYSRAYLHHLFRTKELLAYRLATYHNLFFLERLMEEIRQAVVNNSFLKLKKEWLE